MWMYLYLLVYSCSFIANLRMRSVGDVLSVQYNVEKRITNITHKRQCVTPFPLRPSGTTFDHSNDSTSTHCRIYRNVSTDINDTPNPSNNWQSDALFYKQDIYLFRHCRRLFAFLCCWSVVRGIDVHQLPISGRLALALFRKIA